MKVVSLLGRGPCPRPGFNRFNVVWTPTWAGTGSTFPTARLLSLSYYTLRLNDSQPCRQTKAYVAPGMLVATWSSRKGMAGVPLGGI